MRKEKFSRQFKKRKLNCDMEKTLTKKQACMFLKKLVHLVACAHMLVAVPLKFVNTRALRGGAGEGGSWPLHTHFKDSFGFFGPSMAFLGVRGVLEMIVSHRAPSSLNMSSYRAIWTHFRPNFIFVWPKHLDYQKSKLFLKSKSPHLASLINIWYMGR